MPAGLLLWARAGDERARAVAAARARRLRAARRARLRAGRARRGRASRSSPWPIPTARAAGSSRRSSAPRRTRASSELLAAGPLDGIVICTPPEDHEEVAAAAAHAGLTALVEKPPAPDAAGALRIAALAPVPWIGFNRRFDQGLALARRVPPDGELELNMVLHYRRKSWRPVARGDDALLDLAPAPHRPRAVPHAARCRSRCARTRRASAPGSCSGRRAREVRIECATNRPHHELVEIRRAGGRRVGARPSAAGACAACWPAVARRAPARALADAAARGLRPRAARRGPRPAGDRRRGRRRHARPRRGAPLGRRRRRHGGRRGRPTVLR